MRTPYGRQPRFHSDTSNSFSNNGFSDSTLLLFLSSSAPESRSILVVRFRQKVLQSNDLTTVDWREATTSAFHALSYGRTHCQKHALFQCCLRVVAQAAWSKRSSDRYHIHSLELGALGIELPTFPLKIFSSIRDICLTVRETVKC